jgi:hypothetical protein
MPKVEQYSLTGQCCALDEPYQAPPGYFDQPFVYVFDGDDLTDGRDYRNLAVTTFSGADFLLRRVGGQDRVADRMQLLDVLSRKVFNAPYRTNFHDFPMDPEMMFPAATGIVFDLFNVARVLKTSGLFSVPLSQIVFQGTRRFRGQRRPPGYLYSDDEFGYVFDLDINWSPTDAPRKFSIEIHDFDFELLQITEDITPGGKPGFNTAFKMMLYDQVYEPMFSKPVIDDLLVNNSTDYQGIVPVPGTVYRVGQSIKFDIHSLILPPDQPTAVQLFFRGVRRRPC